jgi:CBS domain-containing protein
VSPRAAWRLETLGFEHVYDYVAGKKDWGSYGLPREGKKAEERSAGELARRDVPTAQLGERLQDVRKRVQDAGWHTCIVVDGERVVLGRLGHRALRSEEDVSVEDSMTPGPSTKRPSIGASAAVELMDRNRLRTLLITTPDGRLVGVLRREDAEQASTMER